MTSGFVTKIISKINSLFVTVVAGGKEGMPNINSTINSLFVDARADIEIDNCDKAERQAWYRKGCARNINGIEKLVDVGENICEGLNGIGFGVNGSRVINSVLERGRSGASDREGGGGDFEGVSGSTRNAFVCCALRGGATEKAGEVVVTSEEIKLSERDCYNFLDGGGAVCSREYVFVEGFAQRSIVQGTTEGGIIADGGASCVEGKESSLNKEVDGHGRLRQGRERISVRQEGRRRSVDSVDESKKEKSDAEINRFVKKAGGIIAKVNGIEIENNASGVHLRQGIEDRRYCSKGCWMIIEGKEEEVGCGAEEVMNSFKSEDLFGDSFVCEDEVRNGGGVCKGTNGASYGGAEAIKCGGVSGGENSSRPRSRSAQTRWRLGRPPKGVVTFGDISEGTNVGCGRVCFMGGQQRDRV